MSATKPSPTARQIGRNISQLRDVLGLTQTQVSELSGLHHSIVSRTERGMSDPTLGTLASLRKALPVSWDTLLKGV